MEINGWMLIRKKWMDADDASLMLKSRDAGILGRWEKLGFRLLNPEEVDCDEDGGWVAILVGCTRTLAHVRGEDLGMLEGNWESGWNRADEADGWELMWLELGRSWSVERVGGCFTDGCTNAG